MATNPPADRSDEGGTSRPRAAELLQARIVGRDPELVRGVLERVVRDGSAEQAASRIVSARRRYVAGAGLSGAYATLLATQLTGGLAHVTLVDTFIRTVDIVSEVRDTDVLVAFSFKPYRRATVDFARLFRAAGAQVVAITDNEHSPLVPHAHDVVFIDPCTAEGEESVTAVAAVSSLLSSLAIASSKGSRRRLQERASISEELGIYIGSI